MKRLRSRIRTVERYFGDKWRALVILPAVGVLALAMGGCVSVSGYRVTGAYAPKANLIADVAWEAGDKGEYHFQWRPTSGGSWSQGPTRLFNKSSDGSGFVAEPVSGLAANSFYEYRVCGRENVDGAWTEVTCADKDGDLYVKQPEAQDPATFWTGKEGRFEGLNMGFGISTFGPDSLLLKRPDDRFNRNGDGQTNRVAEYLDYVKADWVHVRLKWCHFAGDVGGNVSAYQRAYEYVSTAEANDKNTLITISYIAPVELQKNNNPTCAGNGMRQPRSGSVSDGNKAIDSMTDVVRKLGGCLAGTGMGGCPTGADYLDNVAVEIGDEVNFIHPDEQENINRNDAHLAWDVANGAARYAFFTFGRGIAFGGLFFHAKPTSRGGSAGWGGNSVAAKDYLDEAIGHNDDWSNAGTYVSAFGIHVSFCRNIDQNEWATCDGSTKEHLDDLKSSLSSQSVPTDKPIWFTGLFTTSESPANDAEQSRKASSIWDGIQQSYTSGPNPVRLVIWSRLSESSDLHGIRWMTGYELGDPDDPSDGHGKWPWDPKQVWRDAHFWAQ